MTRHSKQRYAGALMNTFGPPKLVLARGEGAHVWDEDGKEYVDLLGGIAVNALGHAHPALVEAVTAPARHPRPRLQLLHQRPAGRAGRAAARAARRATGKVFFANSGAEANEAAFKLTRRTGRTHLVAAEGAFHGRTMGALALTAKEAYREPFEPLPGDVTFVPYGDADALAAAVTDATAAVVLEPIQGEAGVVVPPDGYLAAAREITTEHGALLWLDEVQTGIGRTGRWFAHEPTGVAADIVTLAKGLGGGIPIGACIGVGDAGDLLEPGNHGTTFGGNPVACAAALAVIDTIEADGLLEHVDRARPAAARRPRRRPAGHRGARRGAADRPRPDRRRRRPRSSPRPRTPASSSTTRPRPRSGSRRRSSSPRPTPTRSWPPGRASSTPPGRGRSSHDPALPRATTT